MSRLSHTTVVAYLALFVALGGGALAATGLVGSNGKIRGCVGKHGKLTVLKRGKHCGRGQTAIAWSQKGPKGNSGPQGDDGAKGEPGSPATNADTLDGKDSAAFVPSGAEPWHDAALNSTGTRGTGVPLHHYCFWTAFGSPWSTPGYFRDGLGVVHLRGIAKANDGDDTDCLPNSAQDRTMFTLPEGYHPEADIELTTTSNASPGVVIVRSGGNAEIGENYPDASHARAGVVLDGLTFRCAPSGQNGCP